MKIFNLVGDPLCVMGPNGKKILIMQVKDFISTILVSKILGASVYAMGKNRTTTNNNNIDFLVISDEKYKCIFSTPNSSEETEEVIRVYASQLFNE